MVFENFGCVLFAVCLLHSFIFASLTIPHAVKWVLPRAEGLSDPKTGRTMCARYIYFRHLYTTLHRLILGQFALKQQLLKTTMKTLQDKVEIQSASWFHGLVMHALFFRSSFRHCVLLFLQPQHNWGNVFSMGIFPLLRFMHFSSLSSESPFRIHLVHACFGLFIPTYIECCVLLHLAKESLKTRLGCWEEIIQSRHKGT